jgi:hypothetical protein
VVAAEPLRYSDAWADVIDTLSTYPDVRRKAVPLLAEIDAVARTLGATVQSGSTRFREPT